MRAITSGKGLRVAVVLAIGIVAGCSSGSSATGGPSASTGAANPPASAASSEAAPASPEPTTESTAPEPSLASAVPTAVDPCQLVTQDEASKLAGTKLPAGQEKTLDKTRECSFGAATNRLHVSVIQAPDVATAQAAKGQFEDLLKQQAPTGIKLTELPDFADGAAIAEFSVDVSGQKISGRAIYALKGTIAFGITHIAVGGKAASSADLQAEAQTVLGRLP